MTQWRLSDDQSNWLRKSTLRLIEVATVLSGQVIATGTNTTGRSFLTPGNNLPGTTTYPAFWTRDPAWIAESGFIASKDVWGWVTLLAETMQGHEQRRLSSGGVILPYSLADHINVDGSPVYYPGTYRSDDTQGPPYGKYPPHDDQYWLTFNTYAYAKSTGDYDAITRPIATRCGELPLWQVCTLTHNAFPVDATSQLCLADSSLEEHIVDWGYNDAITKTGKLLFPSLLRYESALKLAHMLDRVGMQADAETNWQQAKTLRRSIIETFYTEDDRHFGWLMSATGKGFKPDIWGTAYAIYLNLLPDELADSAAAYLLHCYRAGTTVLHGQVRHIPTTSGYWEIAQCAPGTYQNGGYWGYPAGWYAAALSRVDADAAAQLISEYISYMRDTWDSALQACAWECINPEMNHYQNPGYLSTLAIPYVALKNKGLLS